MQVRRFTYMCALGLVLGAQQAAAFNIQFASEVPSAHFSEADRATHEQMLRTLLATAPDGKRMSWDNPGTRSGGAAVARRTTAQQGKRCRDVQIKTYFRALKADNTMRACQGEDGNWTLAN
ncbi:RT0821/Lpp0805 family surface protein [Niveibacterium sp. 24ML]|uniref:RT0821/Lpp0805 family surface protein n=1 Tax=Niveibacterium sp. 24ML TaxID=2985512 RepID=UPI00226F638F|nr:RT0821/Lpp0805 family surface protein [Niveibacterium sp. 24ML]MCX9158441.1 RT0821/Lpp0805 family surface protein [Niveibacterium sp. 24ML]